MENINTLICIKEENCPLPVTFGEHNYRHEHHYGQNTIVDNCTGLILEWHGEDPQNGILKKDAGTMFIVIPKGMDQEEYLNEQKQKMIQWYNEQL